MNITPLDIRKKEFKTSMRGYDRVEVDGFMEELSKEMSTLIESNNMLQEQVTKLQKETFNGQMNEQPMGDAPVIRQSNEELSQPGNQTINHPNSESEKMISEAEEYTERLLTEAQQKLTSIKKSLIELEGTKELVLAKVRQTLLVQLQLIDNLDGFTSQPVSAIPTQDISKN